MAQNIWRRLETDVAAIFNKDGESFTITTASGAYNVVGFWDGLSLEQGEQGGPAFYCAASELPAGFTQGDTVTYDGTAYTVTHRQPDGHGIERVILWNEP